VFSVADAFDAMTSDRPYRKAIPFDQACQEIADGAGSQFDPKVVDAFTAIVPGLPTCTHPCTTGLWTAWRAPFPSPPRSPSGGAEPGRGSLKGARARDTAGRS
jgi:hypothetical protein